MIQFGLTLCGGKPIAQCRWCNPNQRVDGELPVTATMIDRLAGTLKGALKGYDAGDDLILIGDRHSEGSLRELVRTVLVEMRSPTDNMQRAGSIFFELDDREALEAAAIVYVDMIDAALAER